MKKTIYTSLLSLLLVFSVHGNADVQNSLKKLTDAEIDIRLEAKSAARHGNLGTLKILTSKHHFLLQSESLVYRLFGDALYRNHYAVADFLLPHIKDYDFITESGNTYISIATGQEKKFKYLKFFLEKSSLINHKAKDGDTAFSSAAAKYNLKAMKILIEHGAKDLDSHSNNNAVPLNVVVAHGDTELVEMMLERGADSNHQYETFYRQFPLQIAVEKGFPDITELLLKHKAEPNKLTCYGETPLYIAEYRSNREHIDEAETLPRKQVVELLKKYGAKMPENKPSSRESFGSFRRVGC